MRKQIRSALISVYDKGGLDQILPLLRKLQINIYSTGGTQRFLEENGLEVHSVENLTSYPSILDGRVKTLHPKVFGGILARREDDHLDQLSKYEIPELDLVVVDLYPFEDTVAQTNSDSEISEKIDIGGISLIRAAAKNFNDVVVIASKNQYQDLYAILNENNGETSKAERKKLALKAFQISSHYDTAITSYFNSDIRDDDFFKVSIQEKATLRYGENPHQEGSYYGDLSKEFDILNGKPLSYNNLVDIDSAIDVMREFGDQLCTFAILKHTNSCGLATRPTVHEAYLAALAGDPLSAFGGILMSNAPIDLKTAEEIDKQFYEVLIAPAFEPDALAHLKKKKNRILLTRISDQEPKIKVKTALGGMLVQTADLAMEGISDIRVVTERSPSQHEIQQLLFANKVAKHLKSNTIVLIKDDQLIGMGCGHTSRIDACKQAIEKAKRMGFQVKGSVMASDAFFPFPDCVEIAHEAGVSAVIQPGGSRNDQLSIDFCNQHDMAMVLTGVRHFKH